MSQSIWLSMTGYAQENWNFENRQFKFQIKSVNHRFFEFRMRAPREWQMLEPSLKSWCKAKLERGSVDLWIEEVETSTQTTEQNLSHNKASIMFKQLSETLKATKAQASLGGGWMPEAVRALILARMPDLWMESAPKNLETKFPQDSEIQSYIESVCDKLITARSTEGEETRQAVNKHILYIRTLWENVSKELPALKESWKAQIEERIQKLCESFTAASITVEPQRLYQEFVMLADKRDVTEEIQRIDSHLKALDQLVQKPTEQNIGKKLDFFMQELNREWTTLSNKIQNSEINQIVGEAKMTIEKIREQSLNLV